MAIPGKNLCIQTLNTHVQNNIKVDLKGEEGEKIDEGKKQDDREDGSHGYDGKPGNPGKPGGSFYLKSKYQTATGTLEIDISGGKGGKGQDGGNGKNGKDGSKSGMEKILKREKDCLVKRTYMKFSDKNTAKDKAMHVIKTLGTYNGQMLEIYQCDGIEGERGGNAGKGGQGGKGGNYGTVTTECPGLQYNEIKNLQNQGENGAHGIPGKGGKYGNT